MSEKQFLRHGLNGNQLKLIAVISMLCDHAAIRLLAYGLIPALYVAGENMAAERWNQAFWILRSVGRMAFPIYVFLLTEGFCHTRNRRRYALRLGVFALISEIPFDLLVYGKIWDTHSQNVFFTLFIGLMVMWGFQAVENQERFAKFKKVIFDAGILAAGILAAEFLNTDYAGIGVACIVLLYVFRKKKSYQLLAGCIGFSWELTAPLAFIPIAFYNGKRGLSLKYFFYIFYPAHLLILYIICWAMGMGPIAVA